MCEPVQTSAARGFQVLPEAPSAHSPDFGIIQEILTSKLGIKPVSSRIAAPYKTSATNDCPWQVQLPDQHAFKEFPAGPEVRLIYPSPGSGVTVLASRVPGMPQPNGIPMSCVRFVKHVLRLREPGFGSGTAASVRFLGQPSHSRRLGSPLSLSCVCVRESSFVLLNALHGNMPAAGSRFRWSSPSPGCDMIVSRSCVPGGMQQNGTAAVQRVGVSKTPWIPFACLLHQSPQLQRALPLLLVRSSHGIPAKFPAGPAFTRSPSPGGMTVVGSSLPSIMRNCSTVASVQFPKLADCVLLPRAAAAMNPGTLIVLGNRAAVGHVLVCHSALRLSCVCVQTRRLCPHMLCGDMPAAGSRWSSPSLGCGMTVVGSRVPRMMQRNNYSAAASPEFLELVGSVHLPRATAATNSGTLIVLRKRAAVGRALARQPFQSQLLGSWTWPSSLCLFDNAVCAAVPCVPGFPWSSPSSGCGMTVSGSRMLGMTQHNSGRAAFARFPQLVACSHRLSTPRIHWIPSGFCTRAVACLPASFQVFGSWASSDSVQSLKLVGSALLPRGAAAMIPGTEIVATNSAALARESQCQTSQSRLLGSFTSPWDALCVVVPSGHGFDGLCARCPAAPAFRGSSPSLGCGMTVGSRVLGMRQYTRSTAGADPAIQGFLIVLRKRAVGCALERHPSQSRLLGSFTSPLAGSLALLNVWRRDIPGAAPRFSRSSPSLGFGMTVLGSRAPSIRQHNGSTKFSVQLRHLAVSMWLRGAAAMIPETFIVLSNRAVARMSRCHTSQSRLLGSFTSPLAGSLALLNVRRRDIPGAAPRFSRSSPSLGCGMTVLVSLATGINGSAADSVQCLKLAGSALWPTGSAAMIPGTEIAATNSAALARESQCQTSQSRLLGSFTAPWDASLGCVSVPRSVLYYLEELSVAFPAGPRLRWSSRSPGCGMFVLGSRVPSIRQHNISTKASVQFRHLAVSTRLRGAAAMIPETFIVLRKRAVARKSRCQTSQSRRLASSTPFWDALRVVVPSVHRFDGLCARCPAAPAFRGSSPSLGCGMTVLGSRVPGMTQHNGSTVGSVLVAPMITGIFSSCNISAAACGTPQPQVFNSCAASVLALRRARELGMDFVLDTLTVTLPADPGLRWSFPRPGCCKTMMESRVPGVMPNNGITVGFVLLFRGARASSVIPTPIVLRERAVARASRCQTSIRVCRSACALSFWSSVGAPVPKLPEGIPFELARAPCALSWAPLKLSPSQVCSSHPAPLVSFSFHFGGPALHSRLLRMKQFKVGMQVAQIEQTHLQHKSKLAANPDGLTVETLLEGPRDAALVLFEGGTRSPPVELERIAGHLARLWPAAAASMTSVEKALHHGGFVALIHEPLTLAQSGESVILAGHSLGANVAQKVAECLDGAGVDVRGIVALDLRTTGRRAAQIPDFHPSLVPALAPRIRLETLQVALESPLVPFPPMPQRQFRLRSEVAQEATVPEMDKLLTDTDHFMLRQSHVWDIAASVYQKVKDSDRRHTNSLNSRACR
ncbi:unnamed protein product [Effrenium voratum]|nr:unnamed protein product [Effrenium voratum]